MPTNRLSRPETSAPKTTRPAAKAQRPQQRNDNKSSSSNGRKPKLDASPDKIDIRDYFYRPGLFVVPDQLINCKRVPHILDQGTEGACTGFALAAVINFHLTVNGRLNTRPGNKMNKPHGDDRYGISPRMLYEMARKYDEWPGENYEGSSARGTIKGWLAHGVVRRLTWPDTLHGSDAFSATMAQEALQVPAGAYYRVEHKQLRHMHSALTESGILFATLLVHSGWYEPSGAPRHYTFFHEKQTTSVTLPVIERKGPARDGHAIAIVGYTRDGFVIQNSWGEEWGMNGFALLPYDDWLMHASDCWVVQLGVPIDAYTSDGATTKVDTGLQRASEMVPLEQIRPFIVDIGNNGYLSNSGDYWTSKDDVQRLFSNIGSVSSGWEKKRVMLYLHGGLNSEREVARRVISFKQVFLDNKIYPVHVMWETGFFESLKDKLFDLTRTDGATNASWLDKCRDAAVEILDRTFEVTTAKLGRLLWDEMKKNAAEASADGANRAMKIVAKCASDAMRGLAKADLEKFELHIVAHSAGAIFTSYAIDTLIQVGVPIKSIQFLAPAISIDLFKSTLLKRIQSTPSKCPLPTMYILSDIGERDDNVGPYGKSLLYLVSNAFEDKRETPILGMERFVNENNTDLDKHYIDPEIANLYSKKQGEKRSLVISGSAPATSEYGYSICRSESHGGFDNDKYTMNSVICRILDVDKPLRPFETTDLVY